MPGKSPFEDEYRASLRAHWKYVIRQGDKRTERTLRHVMKQLGFREDELAQLTLSATAHVDDMPDGFTPDPVMLEQVAAIGKAAEANESAVNPGGVKGDGEPLPPQEAALDMHTAHRHEDALDPAAIEAAEESAAAHDPDPVDDPGEPDIEPPTQLSLF